MKLSMGYPNEDEEIKILERTEHHNPITNIEEPAQSVDDNLFMQDEVRRVRVTDQVKEYIVKMVSATRGDRNTVLGISPRGSIALYKAAKAFAYIYGREYATPDDVKNVAVSVLAHRIILSPQGKTAFGTNERYVEHILASNNVPAMKADDDKKTRNSAQCGGGSLSALYFHFLHTGRNGDSTHIFLIIAPLFSLAAALAARNRAIVTIDSDAYVKRQ